MRNIVGSTIVEEREAKAEELQQILDERQEKADGITAQVAKPMPAAISCSAARCI